MSRGVSAVYPGMNAFNVKRETNVQIPLKNVEFVKNRSRVKGGSASVKRIVFTDYPWYDGESKSRGFFLAESSVV